MLGRPKGPGKSKLDPHREEIEDLLVLGLSKVRIAKKFGTTVVNLHNWMKKNKINDGLKKRIAKYNRREEKLNGDNKRIPL